MKKISILVMTFVLLVASVVSAFAATEECTTTTGSYGQTSTTCKVLGETTVVHETVNAGVGDINFWMVAQILGIVGVSFFGISKLAERTYWFD